MSIEMYEEYENMLSSGEYEIVEEMCNAECLNYSDLYYDQMITIDECLND